MSGPIALVGSGEYLPVLESVEAALIEGRPPRYVQLATAAAPEGRSVLQRWHDLGADAARRLGVEQVVVDVVDGESANDPDQARLVAGAGLVYLSGGSPMYLTQALQGALVWEAILDAWRGGAALAGCSAGAMALGAGFPDLRRPWRQAIPGLGVVPGIEVLPHFDAFASRMPDLVLRRVSGAPDGVQVVGIDEDTALVTGLDGLEDGPAAGAWRVQGRQSVWLLGTHGRQGYAAGRVVHLPAPL